MANEKARTELPKWAPEGVTLDQLNVIELHAVAETINAYGKVMASQVLNMAKTYDKPGLVPKRDIAGGLKHWGINILEATGNGDLVRNKQRTQVVVTDGESDDNG